jgi:hypothetical protein
VSVEQVHRFGHAQTELFTQVSQIPGVAMIIGKPYELIVQKAELHSWDADKIHASIMDLLLLVNVGSVSPASELPQ